MIWRAPSASMAIQAKDMNDSFCPLLLHINHAKKAMARMTKIAKMFSKLNIV